MCVGAFTPMLARMFRMRTCPRQQHADNIKHKRAPCDARTLDGHYTTSSKHASRATTPLPPTTATTARECNGTQSPTPPRCGPPPNHRNGFCHLIGNLTPPMRALDCMPAVYLKSEHYPKLCVRPRSSTSFALPPSPDRNPIAIADPHLSKIVSINI